MLGLWFVILGLVVGARTALNLSGTMLGFYPVKVMPSKTAIAPVNPTFLPRVRFFLVFHHILTAKLWFFRLKRFDFSPVFVLRLKMSVRCVQELSTALTLTRR